MSWASLEGSSIAPCRIDVVFEGMRSRPHELRRETVQEVLTRAFQAAPL